jgi:membrane protein DedA with SNARE-associated domain
MHHHFSFHQFLLTYGYEGLVGALILEFFGVPVFGETLLTVAGFEWGKGVFSMVPLLFFTTAGTFLGSLCAYLIGRYLGRPVILRLGRWVGITEQKLQKAERQFAKYEASVLILSRFIAGIRVLVPYIAGFSGVTTPVFILYSGIGAVLWCAVFLLGGRFLGREWKVIQQEWDDLLVPLLFAGIATAVMVWYLKKRRNSPDRKVPRE